MRRRIDLAVVAVVAMVAIGVPLVGGVAGATSGTLTITTDTTLSEDHLGAIVIGADDVTLDCAGFTVSSETPGTRAGILVSTDGVVVKNCTISGFETGVLVLESTGGTFVENFITRNRIGFWLEDYGDGVIHSVFDSNRVTNNEDGFIALGPSSNEFVRNYVSGNSGAGFFFMETKENSFVGNQVRRNGGAGLLVVLSQDDLISSNQVRENGAGIAIDRGSGHHIVMNHVMRNARYGISLYSAFDMTIARNVGCRNGLLDAIENPGEDLGTGNTWTDNRFCTSDL